MEATQSPHIPHQDCSPLIEDKPLATLVAVAPFNKDSGKKIGQLTIKGGRAQVRKTLYMATLSSIRFNPLVKQFYESLIARGKKEKVAIIACMRKLLSLINRVTQRQTPWIP